MANPRREITEQLLLRGVGGLVEGELFFVGYGDTSIIGRSSECDVSLKRCAKYLQLDPEQQDEERHFHTVSRRQVRISFHNTTSIEIEDLGSSNGTFLDGEQIKKVVINDIKDNNHELLLGTRELFIIEWSDDDAAEVDAADELD
jgi:pSer/pThr/pTyr-binding forkhead associated (FHA) protein